MSPLGERSLVTEHTVTTWREAKEIYRAKHMRQGLYDGGAVMQGVLVNLHGNEHRDRRRLENPLFRRDTFFRYERDQFPAVLEQTLAPYVAAGRAELLELGHRVMLNLAAVNAGIDQTVGSSHETDRLLALMLLLVDGARIMHYTGDREAKERDIVAAIHAFDVEFLTPSLERRQALLDARTRGEITDDEVPRDILRVLLENVEHLELPHDVIVREVAFFLLTGAGTSATTLPKTMERVLDHVARQPHDEHRLVDDPAFVQRCILETLRLGPISPVGVRWATEDMVLADGTAIKSGDRVVVDLVTVNRDPSVFGPTAGDFDPDRVLPPDVALHGMSFGHGVHACIGQELAVGVDPDPADGFDHRLFGLVGTVISELLRRGARRDPHDPPQRDATSAREAWSRYPVVFTSMPAGRGRPTTTHQPTGR